MPTFEAHQEQDKSKAELGLTEEQVETLKQVSSLVGMFQQEALNEKQTRLLAQLKALEKVCASFFFATCNTASHKLYSNVLSDLRN